jgi:hypothetical protein
MSFASRAPSVETHTTAAGKDAFVPWIFGYGAIWLVLIITLGILCIRKGHWVMFIVGIFLPFFWLIGAIMPPRRV